MKEENNKVLMEYRDYGNDYDLEGYEVGGSGDKKILDAIYENLGEEKYHEAEKTLRDTVDEIFHRIGKEIESERDDVESLTAWFGGQPLGERCWDYGFEFKAYIEGENEDERENNLVALAEEIDLELFKRYTDCECMTDNERKLWIESDRIVKKYPGEELI